MSRREREGEDGIRGGREGRPPEPELNFARGGKRVSAAREEGDTVENKQQERNKKNDEK